MQIVSIATRTVTRTIREPPRNEPQPDFGLREREKPSYPKDFAPADRPRGARGIIGVRSSHSDGASSVADYVAAAKAAGIKAITLTVAGAFHSKFMRPAREKLAAVLDGIAFSAPTFPVLANVSGTFHAKDPAVIKETMLRQVTESVHWLDCMQTAVKEGVSEIVEFGPGGVLARMMKRIDKAVAASAVTDVASVEAYAQRG